MYLMQQIHLLSLSNVKSRIQTIPTDHFSSVLFAKYLYLITIEFIEFYPWRFI